MQGGKAQLTWRCTWRWGWRWWRAGRLMLLSPPLFSSWCSSSLPSLCPLFLYFYGFLPLLWSLSLSLSLSTVFALFLFGFFFVCHLCLFLFFPWFLGSLSVSCVLCLLFLCFPQFFPLFASSSSCAPFVF